MKRGIGNDMSRAGIVLNSMPFAPKRRETCPGPSNGFAAPCRRELTVGAGLQMTPLEESDRRRFRLSKVSALSRN